jgi:hypothetical protein
VRRRRSSAGEELTEASADDESFPEPAAEGAEDTTTETEEVTAEAEETPAATEDPATADTVEDDPLLGYQALEDES